MPPASPIVEHEERLGSAIVVLLTVDLHGMTFRRETHAMGSPPGLDWGWVRRTDAARWEWHLAPDAHAAAVHAADRELEAASPGEREALAEVLAPRRAAPSWRPFSDETERALEAGHRAWTAGR